MSTGVSAKAGVGGCLWGVVDGVPHSQAAEVSSFPRKKSSLTFFSLGRPQETPRVSWVDHRCIQRRVLYPQPASGEGRTAPLDAQAVDRGS